MSRDAGTPLIHRIARPGKELLHKDQWPQVWQAVRAEVGQPEWPASIPWPVLLSGGPKTVRELIWHVAGALPRPNTAAGEAWTRPRIQAEIRRIVGEQVGAQVAEVGHLARATS